jgi:magnesium-protoporphyrin IX monomethyl ester (oxidative) cyclase
MTALLPKLSHLQAPDGCGPLLLLRHSPNHDRAAELGFADVQPFPSYELAFGSHAQLTEQAYLFDYTHADGRDPAAYTRALDSEAARWAAAKSRPLAPRCEVWSAFGERVLVDTRRRGRAGRGFARVRRLSDAAWALLLALESPIPRAKLEREWSHDAPLAPLLEQFLRDDWAIEADSRIVRLVVVRNDTSLVREAQRVARIKAKNLWRKLLAARG